MIDLVLLAIVAVVAWCVAAEGAWGAVLTLLSVLFAGILAMNYFEPLASFLETTASLGPAWRNRWDFLSLCLLFIGFIFLFRVGSEQILPNLIDVHPIVHDGMRWLAGVSTGYVTMAILLTALHTAPLPRTFFGFTPERNNFLGMTAPDRQWLGFMQYLTEKSFGHGPNGPVFDGTTTQLANGQSVIVPSFAIRYASRRSMGSGGATQASPATVPTIIKPTAPSRGPGGVNL